MGSLRALSSPSKKVIGHRPKMRNSCSRAIAQSIGCVWVLAILLAACASSPPPSPAPAPPPTRPDPVPTVPPIAEYRIGPEDVIEIIVWKNGDLSKTVTVRPDGIITLPLIGELRASGRTAEEVRRDIKTRLERYKDAPEVSVTITDVRSYNLYILGEVRTPGRYQVKAATTLLQALALAGGFTEYADTNGIVVVRRDTRDMSAKEQRIKIRYKDLIKRGDVALSPGDTVIVP